VEIPEFNDMKAVELKSAWGRWWMVVLYAIAMAWVESAVVFYLRSLIHRIEPYQSDPLPMSGGFATVELLRELATLVMPGEPGGRGLVTRSSRLAFGIFFTTSF
jgi:hypothetical protein